jgi:GTP-binding protein HflX
VTQRQPDPASGAEPERGFLVAVLAPRSEEAAELEEFGELARTAGVTPVAALVQHRQGPDRKTYVGKGKLEELKHAYGEASAESLLVDDELSPPQQRNLENALNARVIDRTQLILDIFAQHARSAEGKLQVELAQLEYNLPRMRGLWQHLERVAGGTATAVGGGVGTRGPGEAQLETDRRLARRRVVVLRRRLNDLRKQRETRRRARQRNEIPTVALAGYTNVGKSTLLNALTGAGVSVDNRLFETLDPTTRGFEHDGRRYLVTDTVGFIRRLPHQLVEGFAATLEETLVSDLVLHVVDASASDEDVDETMAAVNAVLTEIGADDLPREIVLNKIDALDPMGRRRLENRFPGALQVSARTGEGLDELRERIAERFADRFEQVRLLIPYEDGARLNELYALGAPIDERSDLAEGVLVRARLPRRELRRFAPYLVADAEAPAASQA